MLASLREPAHDRRPAAPEPPEEPEAETRPDEATPDRRQPAPMVATSPIKRGFVLTHRWSALVLGLLLLIVTTSGVPLLYEQEIIHARHADAYEAAGPARLSLATPSRSSAPRPGVRVQLDLRRNGVYVADDFEPAAASPSIRATGRSSGTSTR